MEPQLTIVLPAVVRELLRAVGQEDCRGVQTSNDFVCTAGELPEGEIIPPCGGFLALYRSQPRWYDQTPNDRAIEFLQRRCSVGDNNGHSSVLRLPISLDDYTLSLKIFAYQGKSMYRCAETYTSISDCPATASQHL